MTQPNNLPPTSATATPDDPFTKLHKMSTTAGVGSQEYTAVNTLAVITLLFGLASALALIHNVLLAIPVAGIVCGIVALTQIRKSAGTQTGSLMAWLGLILCAALAIYAIAGQVSEYRRRAADREALAQLVNQLDALIAPDAAGATPNYADAYQLFTPRFRQRTSLEEFQSRFEQIEAVPYIGNITGLTWNQRAEFQDQPTGDTATIILTFQTETGASNIREVATFKQEGPRWMLDDLPNLFAPQTPPPPGGAM